MNGKLINLIKIGSATKLVFDTGYLETLTSNFKIRLAGNKFNIKNNGGQGISVNYEDIIDKQGTTNAEGLLDFWGENNYFNKAGWTALPTSERVDISTLSSGKNIFVIDTLTNAPIIITISTKDITTLLQFHWMIIKDESGGAGANIITIETEGSETIDGSSSVNLTVNYADITLYSDGINLFTLN